MGGRYGPAKVEPLEITCQYFSNKLYVGSRHDMPPPRPASGDMIYVMLGTHMDSLPFLYVHVGLEVPAKRPGDLDL